MTSAVFNDQDHQWMAQAIRLADRGRFTTSPNPRVGCVLVKENQLLAQGWHQRAGQGHAEVNALAQLSTGGAGGATAYVTLEPCSHYGKTPPCAKALIDSKVSRVVLAMVDPNPQVAGRGVAMLREAGIQVDVGLLEPQARELNPGFICRMESGRPWVRIKMAASMDGRTAMASGESQWITGAAAREDVQQWRARSCAVLTGAGTALADNPSLTVRPETWRQRVYGEQSDQASVRQPLRVLLDRALKTPLSSSLFDSAAVTRIYTEDASAQYAEALKKKGVTVNDVALVGGKLNLHEVLTDLASVDVNEVLVEAGSVLAGEFIKQQLVDELIVYQAPIIMGATARPLFDWSIDQMAQKIELQVRDCRQVGEDLRTIYTIKKTEGC